MAKKNLLTKLSRNTRRSSGGKIPLKLLPSKKSAVKNMKKRVNVFRAPLNLENKFFTTFSKIPELRTILSVLPAGSISAEEAERKRAVDRIAQRAALRMETPNEKLIRQQLLFAKKEKLKKEWLRSRGYTSKNALEQGQNRDDQQAFRTYENAVNEAVEAAENPTIQSTVGSSGQIISGEGSETFVRPRSKFRFITRGRRVPKLFSLLQPLVEDAEERMENDLGEMNKEQMNQAEERQSAFRNRYFQRHGKDASNADVQDALPKTAEPFSVPSSYEFSLPTSFPLLIKRNIPIF